jgi:hypothetical protein
MGQINTNNYPTVNSLSDADLLIVENATNGTGTTTPKQLRENAIGTGTLQTSAQTVTGAINELKHEIDLGAGVARYDVNTITSGYLGQFSGSANLLLLHLTTDGIADATNGYMMMLSYSRPVARFAIGRLVDSDGVAYKQDIYADNTIICTISGSGEGTESDPVQVVILGIINAGFMLTPTAVVSDRDIIDGQGNTLSVLAEALTKTASGNPIVITDCAGGKARSLITEINAIQDLHGYDKPWVGGADRNLLPDSYTAQSASVFGLTITKVDNGLRFVGTPNWNTQISQFRAASSSDIATLYADGASPACFLKASNQYINIDSCRVDGNDIIVVANTTATTMNVDFTLEFMMYKGTAPTAFRPYSNICPISGRTAVAVERTGQNLWDENYAGIAQSIKYTPIYVGDGSFTLRTTAPRWDNSGCAVFLLAGNVSSGATNADHGAYNGSPRTQTAVNGYVTVAYRIVGDIDPRNYDTELIKTSEITNATIQLGQTVYGADINWDTGVMTVKTAVVDMGSLEWFRTNTHRFQSTGLNGLIYPNSDNVIPPDMKCEIYKPFAAYQTSTTDFGITAFHITSDNTTYLRALDANIDDLTAFMAQIDSKKLEYKLATPTTIQLTPEQLEMLKGYNRVTIDNGSIELGYIAKLT